MAERTGGGRKPSGFIAALVKDPNNPPEVVEITGYIGDAAEEGRTRIYLDTTLQNYVEVDEKAILHVEPVPDGKLGLSHIFVAADAEIHPPPEKAPRLDARSVFGGAVYQDYLSAADAGGAEATFGGGAAPGFGPPTRPFICPTHQVFCPTRPFICPTNQIFCPTKQVFCPTNQPWCPPRTFPPRCPVTHPPICVTRHWPCKTINIVQCTVHPLICGGLQVPDEFEVDPGPYAGAAGSPAALHAQGAMAQGAADVAAPFPGATFGLACRTIGPICASIQIIRCPTVLPIACPPPTSPPFGCPPPYTRLPIWCPPHTLPHVRCPIPTVWPPCELATLPRCPTTHPVVCPPPHTLPHVRCPIPTVWPPCELATARCPTFNGCPSVGLCPSLTCGGWGGFEQVSPEFGAGSAFSAGGYDPYAGYMGG